MPGLILKVTRLPSKEFLHKNMVAVSPVTLATLREEQEKLTQETGTNGIIHVKIDRYVFTAKADESIKDDEIGVGKYERGFLATSDNRNDELYVEVFPTTKEILCGMMEFSVSIEGGKGKARSFVVDCMELKELVLKAYFNSVFGQRQKILVNGTEPRLELQVLKMEGVNLSQYVDGVEGGDNRAGMELEFGLLNRETSMVFTKVDPAYAYKLTNNREAAGGMGSNLFKNNFNLNQLGIGGLGEQFASIFRRAFASRIFPPSIIHKLGLQHVKGVLLYGPPGCGKTLMARQIGKMLNSKEPKIVTGPEIMNKYVGQSEENIRNLFAEAESDYKELGDDSDLHIIIFDEIDAICKQRGTAADSTGVHDSVVNQLLAKMDGVEAINNILIIGMTNRKDMIDEALLRPGRFELCIEIQLPDRKGVEEIYRIHMRSMSDNGLLRGICIDDPSLPEPKQSADADNKPVAHRGTPEEYANFQKLVSMSKNYSGAEIAGVCRCAASYALNRMIQIDNGVVKVNDSKSPVGQTQGQGDIIVTCEDFYAAVKENPPSFGRKEKQHIGGPVSMPVMDAALSRNIASANKIVEYVRNSTNGSCLNILIVGSRGSGKSSIAGYISDKIAKPSVMEVDGQDASVNTRDVYNNNDENNEEEGGEGGDNAFVRIISAPNFVSRGMLNESGKAGAIIRIFQDAFRVRGGASNVSTIVVDDIDRVVEYTQMGMRYSNVIVQSLRGALEMTESTEDIGKGEKKQSATRVVLCTVDKSVANDMTMLGLIDLFPLRIDLEDPDLDEKRKMLVNELGDKLNVSLKEKLETPLKNIMQGTDTENTNINDPTPILSIALNGMSLKQLVFSIDFLKSYEAGAIDEETLISAISMGRS